MYQMVADNPSHVGNAAALTMVPVSWLGVLPSTLSVVLTCMSIVWVGLQISATIKRYLDKRRLARGPRGHTGEQGVQGARGEPGKDAQK